MLCKSGDKRPLLQSIRHFADENTNWPLFNTWLPPTISQERLQWRIYCHQLLQTKQIEWRLWTIRDKRPLLQSKRHTAYENTDWLYLIRDCRLLFHKNDYSDEFVDTNYYKQNKQNDDFELYVTKDRFYKAYGTLPTKTPTDFDKYMTAA